jgi:hypothetical protein
MGDLIDWSDKFRGRGDESGGGPEDPMLEARVARLEDDMREVKGILSRLEPMIIELVHTTARKSDIERIESRLSETREEVKEMKGTLARTPNSTELWRMVIGTWIAGAGVVALAIRLIAP